MPNAKRRRAGKDPEEEQPEFEPESEKASSFQELYADSMNILTGIYTASIEFGELRSGRPPLVRVKINVSPHMLKAISLLTSKHVRDFEEATGGIISLPNKLVHDWGLEEEIR